MNVRPQYFPLKLVEATMRNPGTCVRFSLWYQQPMLHFAFNPQFREGPKPNAREALAQARTALAGGEK